MRVSELHWQQMLELKQAYLTELDNEGTLEEIVGIKALGWADLANADKLVPDDVILENYANTEFSDDDFTVKIKCPRCGGKVELETDPDLARYYKYVCPECDENFYECEVGD